jgi:hypothetical protein
MGEWSGGKAFCPGPMDINLIDDKQEREKGLFNILVN